MAPASRRPAREIAKDLRRLQESSRDRDRILLHEISVYQEELVVQNEALIRARTELEEARDRFIELYDFAPTGYLTLDDDGVILQCNLTATTLFGRGRDKIEGLPLRGLVEPRDQSRYSDWLRRCRAEQLDAGVEGELTMRTAETPRVLQVLCRRRRAARGGPEYFISLVDITARRALEEDRAKLAREHAALAKRLIEVQDQERQRIARDLHDDIGQRHTAIWLKLQLLLQQPVGAPTRQLIEDIRELFTSLDQRVHFVASELRPAVLDLGLVRAVDQFVREWSETFRVKASVLSYIFADVRYPAEIETQLYRIMQEALNNIAKHAAAETVSIIIDTRDGGLVLVIEDDGHGFDSSGCPDRVSLGLAGMRERAQLIGGTLSVESAPGHGTSVCVHVPNIRATQ